MNQLRANVRIPAGFAQKAFRAISSAIARIYSSMVNASFTRPFSERLASAINGYSDIVSSIRRLLLGSSPSTITRFVVPVYIDPVDSHSMRTTPHVSKEVRKCLPAVADFNSAPAVPFVTSIGWVLTPVPHRGPKPVLGAARLSVDTVGTTAYFCTQASTRASLQTDYVVHVKYFGGSAVTLEQPSYGLAAEDFRR